METSDKLLIIIRGLPGSGKTTTALKLKNTYYTDDWFDPEMYFEGWTYDPRFLSHADDWCFDHFSIAVRNSSHCIIVSNTFTNRSTYQPYIDYAKDFGYNVIVLTCSYYNDLPTIERITQ